MESDTLLKALLTISLLLDIPLWMIVRRRGREIAHLEKLLAYAEARHT